MSTSKDAPVQDAAANAGWRIARQVRFQRSLHAKGPFATAWQLCREGSTREVPVETILWYDEDGTPSDNWWGLVGSLYYWRLRNENDGGSLKNFFQVCCCLAGHISGSSQHSQLGRDGGIC